MGCGQSTPTVAIGDERRQEEEGRRQNDRPVTANGAVVVDKQLITGGESFIEGPAPCATRPVYFAQCLRTVQVGSESQMAAMKS